MMLIDTLQVSKELEATFTPEQAQALVKALVRPLTEELVTKQDLRIEMAEVKSEIAGLKAEMVKWITGALAFNLLGTAGLVLTLVRMTGH